MINLDLTHSKAFYNSNDFDAIMQKMNQLRDLLLSGKGAGSDFTGWLKLPEFYSENAAIEEIVATAESLRQNQVVVVIGIGGSYLGSKAVIEALTSYFPASNSCEIIYAGFNISEKYLYELSNYLNDKKFGIVVISKSGTTTEPALAFRFLKQQLEAAVGKVLAAKNIVAITDKNKGALRQMANQNGYKTFNIDDNVGGRYSVLSPVGLLPIALAGIDIKLLIAGALEQIAHDTQASGLSNASFAYSAARNALYKKGKYIELTVSYNDKLQYVLEWWKQLFGESEGKQGKGIFTASALFTTDLHSLGQMIQDGERNIFETVLWLEKQENLLKVNADAENLDGLNYLKDKYLNQINEKAMEGTLAAHVAGGVPNIIIKMKELNAYHLGSLLMFYQFSCALSGYYLSVNPFDQPGVEMYKANMFELLGKPK